MIEIEKNIPVPTDAPGGRKPMYPWADMEVEDSFFVPNRLPVSIRPPVRLTSMGRKFALRAEQNGKVKGTRAWRIA